MTEVSEYNNGNYGGGGGSGGYVDYSQPPPSTAYPGTYGNPGGNYQGNSGGGDTWNQGNRGSGGGYGGNQGTF